MISNKKKLKAPNSIFASSIFPYLKVQKDIINANYNMKISIYFDDYL